MQYFPKLALWVIIVTLATSIAVSVMHLSGVCLSHREPTTQHQHNSTTVSTLVQCMVSVSRTSHVILIHFVLQWRFYATSMLLKYSNLSISAIPSMANS